MRIWCAMVLATMMAVVSPSLSAAAQDGPVGRWSTVRSADVADRMIQASALDEALGWCMRNRGQLAPQSDAGVWWLAKSIEVQALILRRDAEDPSSMIQSVIEPAESFLRAYPDHSRRWFLRWSIWTARRTVAESTVLDAIQRRGDESLVDRAMRLMLDVERGLDELASRVDDAVQDRRQLLQRLTPPGDDRRDAMIQDLLQLRQRIGIARVSGALLRTELFDPQSRDFVGSAATAVRLAADAAAGLPEGSEARDAMERLRTESLLRAGRLDEARRRLESMDGRSSDPQWIALDIRLAIAEGNLSSALGDLKTFYGGTPSSASSSIAMDDARLRYLMALSESSDAPTDSAAAITRWVDAIGQRHGKFARRRAESLLLADAGDDPGSIASRVELLAISGRDHLRSGRYGEAAESLRAAATRAPAAKLASQYAIQAAVAYRQAGDTNAGARLLSDIAEKHHEYSQAPALALQAIVLQSEADPAIATQTLITELRSMVTSWPGSSQAVSAKQWARTVLERNGQPWRAVDVLAWNPPQHWVPDEIRQAAQIGVRALSNGTEPSSPTPVQDVVSKLLESTDAPEWSDEDAVAALAECLVLFADMSDLRKVTQETKVSLDGLRPPLDVFLRLRQGGKSVSMPPPDDADLAKAMAWRLMRDAKDRRGMRRHVAGQLIQWPTLSPDDFAAAERLIWLGRSDEAIALYDAMLSSSPGGIAVLRRAASDLSDSRRGDDWKEAVKLWDRLASGVPQGSDAWYQARLRAAKLYRLSGRASEADKRARYVLLTRPPNDSKLKQAFRALVLTEASDKADK
ncbi:hypothetical protein [Crateriforma conspicua]|nr:hypothetical protein [Crateriforma conspicua]